MIERRNLNIAIDTLIFFNFLFLIFTGLILKYRLPPGTGGGGGEGSMDWVEGICLFNGTRLAMNGGRFISSWLWCWSA